MRVLLTPPDWVLRWIVQMQNSTYKHTSVAPLKYALYDNPMLPTLASFSHSNNQKVRNAPKLHTIPMFAVAAHLLRYSHVSLPV